LYDLKIFQQVFGSNAKFTPRIRFQTCVDCGRDQVKKNCVGGGKYCSFTTPELGQVKVTGAKLIAESIRERCIYDVLEKKDKPDYKLWFKYMMAFKDACEQNVNLTCSQNVMDGLGISSSAVAKCYKKVTSGDSDLLTEDRNTMLELGVVTQPAITINN